MMTFRHAIAVTASDSTIVKYRALYVGGAGDVAVQMLADGNSVTFKAVPAGTTLWIEVDMVKSTGTTATNIVGLN
jgi:hypothetical protein